MMREGEGEERDDSNKKSTVFNEARCGFITLPVGCMLISVTPAVRSIVYMLLRSALQAHELLARDCSL